MLIMGSKMKTGRKKSHLMTIFYFNSDNDDLDDDEDYDQDHDNDAKDDIITRENREMVGVGFRIPADNGIDMGELGLDEHLDDDDDDGGDDD